MFSEIRMKEDVVRGLKEEVAGIAAAEEEEEDVGDCEEIREEVQTTDEDEQEAEMEEGQEDENRRKRRSVASGDADADAAKANSSWSSAEEMEVDPFYHRLNLTRLQWARTLLLSVLLFPLRLALVMTCVVSAWLVCTLAMAGLTREQLAEAPLCGWRRRLRHLAMFFGRRCSNAAGFAPVRVLGRRASPEEAPVLVVAPHSTFFDGMVAFWCGAPYLVSRTENRSIPFIGRCIECAQALMVSREDPKSRQKTVLEILRRSAPAPPGSDPDRCWPQLVIFPEGSTANRRALMSFKPGGFYPGRPVQPVVVRYPNKLDTVTW